MRSFSASAFATAILAVCATLGSCAASPVTSGHPDFSGTWSGFITTQDEAYWTLADAMCFAGCPEIFHRELVSKLRDPSSQGQDRAAFLPAVTATTIADREARSTAEGIKQIAATNVPGSVPLAAYCVPYGFVREALNALPIEIRQDKGRIVINYEEFGQSREIWMDGRRLQAHPVNAHLGHSVGHFEGKVLVVETNGISADHFIMLQTPTLWWGGFADGATAVERYTIEESPRRLTVLLTISDPVTLTQPYTWTKTWLSTPAIGLMKDSCEEVPGER